MALLVLGRSRYAQNLDLLVPFFDSPSLELESIEKVRMFACFGGYLAVVRLNCRFSVSNTAQAVYPSSPSDICYY
jgi:hypothetical protein